MIDPLISKSGRYFQEGGFLGWVFLGIYTLGHIMYIAIVNANSDIFMVKCYPKSTSIRWFNCFSDRNSISPRIPLPYITMCIEFWWPREWTKKKCTNILLHTAKIIDPRVKSQARGQNNGSRALKWGIVHLCSSITFRDTTSFIEIWVFQILRFCKKMWKLLC